jgi:mannose-1-phosphate guanylyltransferase
MAPLTQALHGQPLPKQFAALAGTRTFFQQTLERASLVVAPECIVAVVSDEHEALARQQAAGLPGVQIVCQPRNLGTGPGLLLPLAHVLARDPLARVVVFPSDHYFQRPVALTTAVARALTAAAEDSPAGVALVGAAAEAPSTELGWIVLGPDGAAGGRAGFPVAGFVEKPDEQKAWQLLESRALWNTMIMAGSALALWRLLLRHLPRQVIALSRYLSHIDTPDGREVLRDIYRDMLPADFSRDVLERARGLAVVPMIDAGWSDCGTPERLIAALKGTPALDQLLERLGLRGHNPALQSAAGLAAAS